MGEPAEHAFLEGGRLETVRIQVKWDAMLRNEGRETKAKTHLSEIQDGETQVLRWNKFKVAQW